MVTQVICKLLSQRSVVPRYWRGPSGAVGGTRKRKHGLLRRAWRRMRWPALWRVGTAFTPTSFTAGGGSFDQRRR